MKNTRENIFAAAKELFSAKGFAATTTREIAAKAGISEVTLFRQFKTKRKLFRETISRYMSPYRLEVFFNDDIKYDLKKDLHSFACGVHKMFIENNALIKMMFKDVIENSIEHENYINNDLRMQDDLLNYFKTMYKLGKITEDPEMATRFFLSNINGYMMRNYMFRHNPDNEGYFEWLLSKTIQSIGGENNNID